jgi:nicotinamide-nucleotide amidase
VDVLAAQVGGALKSHGLMLVTAESCTGGGVAHAITEIGGSSAWFDRGFITYSNDSKREILGVPPEAIEQHGAVSEAVVREMVAGALYYSHAQVAVAVSGIAGPSGGTPEKPVGTVWFAWGLKDKMCVTRLHHFNGNRAEIRAQSVRAALVGILELLDRATEIA